MTWGWNEYGQCDVPEPNAGFVAIACGEGHSIGLKFDGTIAAWGWNKYGQCDVPEPNAGFVAIAAGHRHNLGIKGPVTNWLDATVDFNPNTLNCVNREGYTACRIGLPAGYDPRDVDIATVTLNGSVFAASWAVTKSDDDTGSGSDLIVRFARDQVIAILPVGDDVKVRITGELGDGSWFVGSDVVRVICEDVPKVSAAPRASLRVDSGSAQATVSYGVAADGYARLRVYNVAGKLVATLVDGWQTRGEHSIVWDGRSTAGVEVSAGVYFVALESANSMRTAKVIVLK